MSEGISGTYDLIKIAGEALALAVILIRMGKMAGSFEASNAQQTKEISEMKIQMTKLSELVTTVAVQKVGMDNMQFQITTLTRWYDELRHGNGYVRPE